ncbi:hypothetical protein [Pseudoduganella sp. OTU4001]|uniref:hypothetical protein n=1 Tax=Pseudoduganella sp. OTU4001 TaxID=3043854 RepID=UPI00313BF9C9
MDHNRNLTLYLPAALIVACALLLPVDALSALGMGKFRVSNTFPGDALVRNAAPDFPDYLDQGSNAQVWQWPG